jgi:hypothetical protein
MKFGSILLFKKTFYKSPLPPLFKGGNGGDFLRLSLEKVIQIQFISDPHSLRPSASYYFYFWK